MRSIVAIALNATPAAHSMELPRLLDHLGYSDASERFLRAGTVAFERAESVGHILRHAAGRECALRGVYQLQPPPGGGPAIPVAYVCEARDEAAARRIHRLVWNQDIAPFVLVRIPHGIRLYSGFEYPSEDANPDAGLLTPLIRFNEIADRLAAFTAEGIDSGEIWRKWGDRVRPQARVYWKLLNSLRELDRWLRDRAMLDELVRHALIGKYVYLHYLKDRDILSSARLEEWGISPESIFGRSATVAGLNAVTEKLDGFLNGRVFPLKLRGAGAPQDDHVQRVAGAFQGDEFQGENWQLHLDFRAYDFSFIPIETLSMIYEQFLHLPETADVNDEHSEGRKAGAYYTPIPVVNFMLSELEQHRPLHRGVTVFDPSCGSGAFLVQCYRRLIEREFPAGKKKPTPQELKHLLKTHIFGVDLDPDACSVAEFSLVLTLLDYVDPPDLLQYPRFRLPTLRDENIFESDFFDDRLRHAGKLGSRRFDWIAGNPPWKRLETKSIQPRDERAMEWMEEHTADCPVGKYSLAQAFMWRCRDFLHPKGEAALLIPAMTLFEDVSVGFRAAFFRMNHAHTVANFSNLAEVLFAGRSRVPAAALMFRQKAKGEQLDLDEATAVFSPLIANQEPTRPPGPGEKTESWGLAINGNEIRDLSLSDLADGSGLPWKLAMWGSALDGNLLRRMKRKWKTIGDVEVPWSAKERRFKASRPEHVFSISEGPQLREELGDGKTLVEELKDKPVADMDVFKEWRRIFSFNTFTLPPNTHHYLRERGGWKGLPVCRPPHVVVSAARNFAVFSNEFIVVWSRQIGIGSPTGNAELLKAMALYLSSDFAFYHQFITTTQFGVQRGVATFESLRQLPCPLHSLAPTDLVEWVALHDRLARTSPRRMEQSEADTPDDGQPTLIAELNHLVFRLLGLDEREQALVHDLVHVRLALNDGKVGPEATREPRVAEMETYARWLRRELDDFVGEESERRHAVTVVYDDHSAMVAIDFTRAATAAPHVLCADTADAATLERTRQRLRGEHAQWVYFDRALKIYRGRQTFLFKPRQRFHWTRTQAMLDAGDIIAETLAP